MIYMTIACITWINLFFYPQCNPSSLLLISVSVFYNLYLFLFPTMCSVWCIWCFADLLQVMERTTIRRRKRRSCPSVRGTRATWSCGRWPRPSSQGTKETDQAVSYLGVTVSTVGTETCIIPSHSVEQVKDIVNQSDVNV